MLYKYILKSIFYLIIKVNNCYIKKFHYNNYNKYEHKRYSKKNSKRC